MKDNCLKRWVPFWSRPIDPTVNTPTVIAPTVITPTVSTPTGNPTCCVIARNSSGANRDGWQGTRRHGWRPPRVCVCVGVMPSAFWPAEVQRKLETFIIETLYVFINEYLYRNTRLLRDKENPLYTGVPDIHQFTPFILLIPYTPTSVLPLPNQ